MIIVIDTNVLVRSYQTGHSQSATATTAVAKLFSAGHDLVLFPQNIYEFWVVATRPAAVNGLGMIPADVAAEIAALRRDLRLLSDTAAIFPTWLSLVVAHGVCGKPAHDARLAAAMRVHGVAHILTFNGADFARYPGVTVLDPAAV